MPEKIDESTPEYQEFLAWRASQPEKPEAEPTGDVVDLSKPLTDTEARKVAEGAETTGDVEDAAPPVDEPAPATAAPADVDEKPLTDTEARRVADEETQGQDGDVEASAPGAPTPAGFDESSYEFDVPELVKRDGPVPGTKTYGLVVKRAPMPTSTPDGKVLPGYVVASLGLTNEVLSTSQDLGLEKI